MQLRHGSVLLFCAAIFQCAAIARGDGLIRDGVGPISTGRGGTNQGFADNSVIIMDNPAGMVNVAGCGLGELGVDTAITVAEYSDSFGNDVNSKVRPLPSAVLGIVKKSCDGRWAVGLGVFSPAGFGASYGVLDNPVTGPSLTRSLGAMGKLLPAIAYKPTERLALGLSVGVGFSYASFDGPFYLQSGALAGVPAVLDVEGTGVAPCGAVGLQYQLTPSTVVGATYTEQTNFWLHGGTNATLLPGFLVESHFNSKVHLKWPRSVAVGIKHDLCAHRRIAADVIWFDWAHAFGQVDLVLYDPSNPAIPAILAGVGESLPVHQGFPLRWTNTVSLRLGYETDFSDLDTLRCGYVYHSSPSPDSTLNPYFDGVLQHAFSLGYSRKMGGAIFNAAYQYNFGPQRHVDTSAFIGGLFDDTDFSAQAHFAMLSLLFPF
jgi:long-subunit fatty acid transport protein